jgi:hypothetical protein
MTKGQTQPHWTADVISLLGTPCWELRVGNCSLKRSGQAILEPSFEQMRVHSSYCLEMAGLPMCHSRRFKQGCQMVYFQTKNTNSGKLWRASHWKLYILVHFPGFGIVNQEKSGNPGFKARHLNRFQHVKWVASCSCFFAVKELLIFTGN